MLTCNDLVSPPLTRTCSVIKSGLKSIYSVLLTSEERLGLMNMHQWRDLPWKKGNDSAIRQNDAACSQLQNKKDVLENV